LAAVEKASRRYGDGERNLALLTDGLRAEREQGITIDVAHRYFATPHRSFIVADTPGHAQYTRNMVTGASTADVAIVLVDARHGVLEQTRRHAFIASLLGVKAIALAVNKMDLVEWDEGEFDSVAKDLAGYVEALPTPVPVVAFPISALYGDNVVTVSERSPWYDGPALLDWLETFDASGVVETRARLDVQRVIRPQGSDFRGLAGRLSGGSLRIGDAVTVLPSGRTSIVSGIQRFGREILVAATGQAITVSLDDNIDVARGDVLVVGVASPTELVSGHVCWMIDQPLREGSRYWFKHGTRVGRAVVDAVEYRHDLHTLEPIAASEIELNDLAMVRLSLSEPIVASPYEISHESGRLILVDEATNTTAGAMMITVAA
ncbi:MAG TPA: GTP-binding protein, partial [Ilumatobacteraceae bacterium]|nr:GTP-binding protein [Ilumatobacteraceae bacterium]